MYLIGVNVGPVDRLMFFLSKFFLQIFIVSDVLELRFLMASIEIFLSLFFHDFDYSDDKKNFTFDLASQLKDFSRNRHC